LEGDCSVTLIYGAMLELRVVYYFESPVYS